MSRFSTIAGAATALASLQGCAASPSLNVFGAYFPGWLFCMAGGLVMTLLARAIFNATGFGAGPLIVVYPLLTILFSLILWILFFMN